MATLVLTAVGSLVGGPVGGAIGAALGSRIDGGLFAPRRRGPRIGDLSVQTSSYGTALPRLFGTMRVAGTVIWATDLREDSHRSGGGKGGGAATTYSYSASFAVALSGRPIAAVRRIWADGKLLRGAAGDWKSDLAGFRLHTGEEDQLADPLIASAEGILSAPGHCGLAYAVFEALQLADFGNRIPSLTFEVEADPADVEIGAVVEALSDGEIVGPAGARIDGYAAGGDNVRAAIEALAEAFPLSITDDGIVLRLGDAIETELEPVELGGRTDDRRESRIVRDRRAALALSDEVAIGYYEPVRDYQAGLQRARREGMALRSRRIELPAAISADVAKGLAEAALTRAWRERERATVRLPWRKMGLRAGESVILDGARWRITSWTLEHMVLELGLIRIGEGGVPAAEAAPGRAVGGMDAPAGETVIELLDLPGIDGGAEVPRLWLAAAGTGPGWRRATASLSLDAGASWRTLGMTAPATTMGIAIGALSPGPRELFDRENRLEIDLLHDGMALPGGGDDALIGGRNLALIGDELITFADATQIAPRRWRISGLLRGRYGSDWAMAGHGAGERFVLIEPERLLPIDLPTATIGGTIRVAALATGSVGPPAMRETDMIGRSLRPPCPVALAASRLADGTIRLSWIRRSRQGWAWLDGTDVPLGEDSELYRLTLSSDDMDRVIDCAAPHFDLVAGEQSAGLLAGTSPLAVSIAQVGRFGISLPAATRTFILAGA